MLLSLSEMLRVLEITGYTLGECLMKLPNLEKIQFGEPNNKRLVCPDGFWLSVQGDESAYSSPRRKCFNIYAYSEMEITGSEVLPPEFSKYREGKGSCVYGYVPVAMIEALLVSHGGVVILCP